MIDRFPSGRTRKNVESVEKHPLACPNSTGGPGQALPVCFCLARWLSVVAKGSSWPSGMVTSPLIQASSSSCEILRRAASCWRPIKSAHRRTSCRFAVLSIRPEHSTLTERFRFPHKERRRVCAIEHTFAISYIPHDSGHERRGCFVTVSSWTTNSFSWHWGWSLL